MSFRRINAKERAELDSLRAANPRLDPEAVIKAARSDTSALHGRFTWDKSKAARLWNLHEARNLIASYRIVIEKRPDTNVRVNVRKFESPVEHRDHGGGYVEPTAAQLRAIALREISGWETRMRGLMEKMDLDPNESREAFDALRACVGLATDQAAE